jgi:hypothetical protein
MSLVCCFYFNLEQKSTRPERCSCFDSSSAELVSVFWFLNGTYSASPRVLNLPNRVVAKSSTQLGLFPKRNRRLHRTTVRQ